MNYDPSNRSYQYMLLQNQAFHEYAIKNQRSEFQQLFGGPRTLTPIDGPRRNRMKTLVVQSPSEDRIAQKKKKKKRRSKSRNTSKENAASRTITLPNVVPHPKKGGFRLWEENLKLVHRLMEIKPMVATREAHEKSTKKNEMYKRSISTFNPGTRKPKQVMTIETLNDIHDQQQYQLKALQYYIKSHTPSSNQIGRPTSRVKTSKTSKPKKNILELTEHSIISDTVDQYLEGDNVFIEQSSTRGGDDLPSLTNESRKGKRSTRATPKDLLLQNDQ